MAVATSSFKASFDEKTSHLDFSCFDVIVTGDSGEIANGKPAPDIYHLALAKLNKHRGTNNKPHECLVFEDGIPGVLSGKAFGAKVIWIPDPRAVKALGESKVKEVLGDNGELLESLEGFRVD